MKKSSSLLLAVSLGMVTTAVLVWHPRGSGVRYRNPSSPSESELSLAPTSLQLRSSDVSHSTHRIAPPESQALATAADRIEADIDVSLKLAASFSDEQRSIAYTRIGRMLAASDPKRALSLAVNFPEGLRRDSFITEVAHGWAQSNPVKAAAWAKGLPEETLRRAVQSAISIEWAQAEPAEAAKYVATEMESGADQEAAATTVAVRWASLEPRQAAAWAQLFPEGATRIRVRLAVTSVWAASDPEGARAWRLKQVSH